MRYPLVLFLVATAGCDTRHEIEIQKRKDRERSVAELRKESDAFFLGLAKNDIDVSKPLTWEFVFAGMKEDEVAKTLAYLRSNGLTQVDPTFYTVYREEDIFVGFKEVRVHTIDSYFDRFLQLSDYAEAHGFRFQDWSAWIDLAKEAPPINDEIDPFAPRGTLEE